MHIALVTPHQRVAGGNTTTADRWAEILGGLGHTVDVRDDWRGGPHDVLVALHARKSAAAIARFSGPIAVAATGTDLYVDLVGPHRDVVLGSLGRARRIVALHGRAAEVVPEVLRDRVRTILQSVVPLPAPPPKDPPYAVLVCAHVRAVKDPLTAARAAARLDARSRIRVTHVGELLEPELAEPLAAAQGARFRSVGGRDRGDTLAAIARSHLLVVPSVHEGGANVIGEAIVHGVPPIVSTAHGNLGLVGDDWPLTFPVGDDAALADALARWEGERDLREALAVRTAALAPRFARSREIDGWRGLVAELVDGGTGAGHGGT